VAEATAPRPAVSVVIAAFNAEGMLGDQLAALSRQRVSFPFEVLVCDNGSSDGTVAVAERWRAQGVPVRLVDASARRGPGAARNAGSAVAASPLLVFCDADDVVADEWLREMYTTLQAAQFVTGTSRRPVPDAPPGAPLYRDFSTYRMPYFPQLPVAGAGNIGVHRAAFAGVGGFDESLMAGEDLDFCWRMQLAGHRLERCSGAIVFVSNRTGLGSTFRQAYGYGVGDKRLRHKYAKVVRTFVDVEVIPVAFDVPTNDATPAVPSSHLAALVRSVIHKVARVRRDTKPTRLVRRLGTGIGVRFGRVDRSTTQLEPPAHPELVGR
jgi:glycosyltransferase involved in cell wall biosynthesis